MRTPCCCQETPRHSATLPKTDALGPLGSRPGYMGGLSDTLSVRRTTQRKKLVDRVSITRLPAGPTQDIFAIPMNAFEQLGLCANCMPVLGVSMQQYKPIIHSHEQPSWCIEG